MEWVDTEFVQSALTVIRSVNVGAPPDYLPQGPNWPITRTIILLFAIVVTLIAILLLYGGNLQNTNIGPIALRSVTQTSENHFKAPRDIVGSVLEGKAVRCTFYLSYLDNRGKTRLEKLATKSYVFKLSALNRRLGFSRADMFGFWNVSQDQSLQDAFVESSLPYNDEDKGFFVNVNRDDAALRRHLGDDDEVVAVSSSVWEELSKEHGSFIKRKLSRFKKFYVRKNGKTRKSFKNAGAYRDLPDFAQDANIYMRMHFSPNPLTHPDPQVKTTAWLTVLTSAFALLTQWLYVGF